MRRTDADRFAKGHDRTFVGFGSALHFRWSEQLWGVAFWGRPDEACIEALVRSLAVELDHPPHLSLIDARRLTGVDQSAFGGLGAYVTAHREALSGAVRALAMVRPPGFEGAVVSGFFEVLPRPYETLIADSLDTGLSWLGERGLEAPGEELASGIASAVLEVQAMPAVVGALRAYLDGKRGEGTLAEAATELGMSERSLQRRLTESSTSFSEEIAAARLRLAKSLLLDTAWPITRIALEVGYSSLQHFSAQFRKATGTTPSEFRKAAGS